MAEAPQFETTEAGALWGLYYALYYAPGEWWRDNAGGLPDSIMHAYANVQRIAKGRGEDTSHLTPVWVGDYIDPLRYVSKPEEASHG